ncbi:hypothetical protein [Nocardia sp. N2S4-5]|uniref:hypothetical protein n=1 Tax=Nocardia sp. N2S4-5 TaxID=3351565 RepID=UPI0037D1CFEE
MAVLDPAQRRYAELSREPERVRELLRQGANRARGRARAKVDLAKREIGLLPLRD